MKIIMQRLCKTLLLAGLLCTTLSSGQELVQRLDESTFQLGGLVLNAEQGLVRVPAHINQSRGWIEVALCTPRGKAHESLLVTDVTPLTLQTALIALGYTARNQPDAPPADADSLYLTLCWSDTSGSHQTRLESLIWNVPENRPMTHMAWEFCGSPIYPTGELAAEFEQTLIATYQLAAVLINSRSSRTDDSFYKVNETAVPPKGTAVELIIHPQPLTGGEQ